MDAGTSYTLHPGPIDNSVLTLQNHHRSTDIWNGHDFEPLTCRRCDGHFWRLDAVAPRVQQMMLKSGFYGVYKAGRIRLDHALITALVERWRPETHTFHLPAGEATVTLQDISVLWGLPVDGDPITGVDTNRSMDEWQDICGELLGFRPPPEDFDRGRLKIRCLQERFKMLPDDASDQTVEYYARAYILQLLGGQLLSDMSNNKVKLMYLPLLRDLEAAGRLSWGSAVLACLYRALCRATKPETSDICGPLVLLQICLTAIFLVREVWNIGFKLESVGTHVLVLYRDLLDNMKDDQFIWEPYSLDVLGILPEYCLSGRRIWQTVAPLICFDVVEFHHPDRALRQFGQQQPIPAACDTIPDIHFTDRRGRQNYDWVQHHRQFVDMWARREARVVTAPKIECPMDQSDPYMMWYRRITRLLIGNPAARPSNGYQGGGGAKEAMAQSLQKIYHLVSDALNQGCEISGEEVLRDILDVCTYSLRTAHEGHRLLSALPDLGPSSPATSLSIPPKAQRGRQRKRGGFLGGAALENRKRASYIPVTVSTPSLGVMHSPMPSITVPDTGVDTPQTWDSSLCISEFHDTPDSNAMQLDPEASDTKDPFLHALGKIRDICSFTLRTNAVETSTLKQEEGAGAGAGAAVGPKTKHCKPRRRGGMSGAHTVGQGAYFASTPEQPSPTESTQLNNGEQNAACHHPFAAVEQEDNLQSEMIELDTITGSREPSPSAAVDKLEGSNTKEDEGNGGKRKEGAVDEVGSTDLVANGPIAANDDDCGRSVSSEHVVEGGVWSSVVGGVRDDVQKKYKRQRRSAAAQMASDYLFSSAAYANGTFIKVKTGTQYS
ncbi:aminotransferase-like [Striga asiatica]|uniref:Aminotransferase-like n=1 Tax=Striga asiatica TaxID=4170 RepID=A0A5A7QL44_STRAF|nr:aminotransferase-like [Striga asiatica]